MRIKKYKINIIFMVIINVLFFLCPFPTILSNLIDTTYNLGLIDIWINIGAIISFLILFNILGYVLGEIWKLYNM